MMAELSFTARKTLAVLTLTAALFLFFCHNWLLFQFTHFLSETVSSDQQISAEVASRLNLSIFYIAACSSLFAAVLFFSCRNFFENNLEGSVDAASHGNRLKPQTLFIFSTGVGVLLIILFVPFYSGHAPQLGFLFTEDGIFETLSAFAFGVAGILCIASNKAMGQANPVLGRTIIYLIAAGFLFIAMEEISWGQRILGWQTPDYLKNVNQQQETTVHNIQSLSGLFNFLSLLPVSLIFINAAPLFFKKPITLTRLLPDPALLGLSFLIGCTAVTVQGEIMEELISIFAFLYSYLLFKKSQFFKTKTSIGNDIEK